MEAVLFQPMKNKIFRMLSTENRIDVEFGHIGNKLYKNHIRYLFGMKYIRKR